MGIVLLFLAIILITGALYGGNNLGEIIRRGFIPSIGVFLALLLCYAAITISITGQNSISTKAPIMILPVVFVLLVWHLRNFRTSKKT
jgi:uncharacterized YccA/Bax inhibitor family protein